MQMGIFLCQWKSCCVENCCLAQALDIRFDFLLRPQIRRHYMLCLSQCQSDSAPTRTYWSSRGTAGRNARFKDSWDLFFCFVRHFEFSSGLPLYTSSQTPVHRSPAFPVPCSPAFPVPRRSPFPVPRPSISNIRFQELDFTVRCLPGF